MNSTNSLELPIFELPVINTFAIIGTGTYMAEKKIRPLSLTSVKELRFVEQEKIPDHSKTNDQGKDDDKKKVRSLLLATTALAKFRSHAKRKDRRIGSVKSPGASPQMRRKSVSAFFKDETFDGDWCRRNLASDIESSQKHSNDDLNHSGSNSPSTPMRRLYVQEGHVKLTYMGSTNERFMFLFNDLLLVAKPKSASTFKLKEKVRVSEIWLSTTIDDVAETTLPPEKCFTIGWPTVNYVAGFNTPEEKDLWYKTLQKCRDEQQERLELKEVTVNVINKINQEDSYSIQSATLTVTVKHDAKAVVKMAQEQFQIQPDEHSLYQLWLASKEIPCPLLGHEIPYSIKVYHSRMRDSLRDESDGIDFDTSCQFYLRKSKQTGNRMSLDLINNQKKWKNPMKKSPIYNWAMNKKTSKYSSSQYPHGSGKLFGLPLTSLSNEEELIPKPIQSILVQLFRRGPGTTGIFRKSALQRTAKEIRQNLDTGRDENMDGTSVIVLAAVLKDFFRSMPDSLIPSTLYENLVGTKSTTNVETRADEIKKILLLLPKENYELTMKFICVLHHIQRFSDRNNMNSYNLSICVSQSIMWPPSTSRMEATEQTSRTSDFICFLIDNFVTIFGPENEYILGNEVEIQFTDGPGEDSDSGTDQPIYRLRQDETDWEKYDSEKEIELPNTPIDSVFTPTKSNLDSPFALSDSSICTIDSDDVKRNSVSLAAGSAIKPTLHANIKRESDENGRGDASDHENTDFNEIFQRNLLRHPKHKRVLSSTTTSAELIEHKRNLKNEDHDSERKTEPASIDSIKQNSEIVPKKYIISHPVIKHFSTEYSATPNTVFHSVDRRRQPAAPSYEEHIQRTQAKHRIIKPEVRKKSIPPQQVQQLNVENYVPPTPQNNKTCSMNHEIIISKDDNKNLSNPVNNSGHSEISPLKSANLTFTSIDPDSTHVRPVGIESLIATFQQYSSTAETSAFSKKFSRQANIDRPTEASKSSQHDKYDEKITENVDFENSHLTESQRITKTCEEDPQSSESFNSHSKEEKIISTVLPTPKLITLPKKNYLTSEQNYLTSEQNYIGSNDRSTNGVHSEEIDLISSEKSNKNRTINDTKKDNENIALSSSQISKNGKIRLSSVESFEKPSPLIINDSLYQQPSQFNNPFSLKLKSEYKQSLPNTNDVRSQSLQVKKTCLTQAPKKIDQLTNCNVIKENQNKIITARELRRTNRRLKKEIRNAFNEGNFVYKYSNDGHKPSSEVSNGLCCYKHPHWKSDNEMFNVFSCGDNNNRILNSHTGPLPQDESCV